MHPSPPAGSILPACRSLATGLGFHTGLVARLWRAVGALSADKDALLVAQSSIYRVERVCSTFRVGTGGSRSGSPSAASKFMASTSPPMRSISHAQWPLSEECRRGSRSQTSGTSPESGPFDAIVSWGNSFGYLPPAETQASLAALRGMLVAGGRFVIQTGTVAESSLPRGISDLEEHEIGGVQMVEHNRYDHRPQRDRDRLRLPGGRRGGAAQLPPVRLHRAARSLACWRRPASAGSPAGCGRRSPYELASPR